MDWGQLVFKGMYKASSFLVGVAAQKTLDVPGLFSVLLKRASENALPTSPGMMTAAGIPSLYLNLHSAHALVLFSAIRAEKKYGGPREQLDAIMDAMQKFAGSIASAISSSSPVPVELPSIAIDLRRMPSASEASAYTGQVNEAIAHTRAFVALQDIILDDIGRCIAEWNQFLARVRRLLQEDKPRNIFEQLGRNVLEERREWVQFEDATSFGNAVTRLTGHRNQWAKLLDLMPAASLPSVQY